MFLVNLVLELANDQKPTQARQMAGIILKNTLTSKDEKKQMQLHLQWKQLPEDIKKQVRVQVINALHSSTKEARRVAAQVCLLNCY
jgi:importin subunit beta-1